MLIILVWNMTGEHFSILKLINLITTASKKKMSTPRKSTKKFKVNNFSCKSHHSSFSILICLESINEGYTGGILTEKIIIILQVFKFNRKIMIILQVFNFNRKIMIILQVF